MSNYKVPQLATFEWQQSIKDKDLSTPVGLTPSKGDRYIVKATGSGDWTGHSNAITTYNGATWDFVEAVEGLVCYVADEDLVYIYTTSWKKLGIADALTKSITQASHGFVAGDVLKFTGGVYAKAKADAATNAEVIGIVYSNDGTNDFTLLTSGYIDTLSGLTANTLYFLSDATAGLLTATEPTTEGSISKPILLAVSTTAGYFINYRGSQIASTSSYYRSFQNGDLASSILTVTHNFGHKYSTVIVSDNSDKVIIPDEITYTDSNNVSIDLTSYGVISGTWHVWCLDIGATYAVTPKSKSFIITNPTADSDGPIWRAPSDLTITNVHVLCVGGTNIIGMLWEYDANGANGSTVGSDITGIAGTNVNDAGSLANPDIASGNYLGWKTTSVSGTPTKVIVTFDYNMV